MEVFLNAAVDSDTEIGWHLRRQDADAITIIIGHQQLSLEFFDVQSLELLRAVANDAVTRLRAALRERGRALAEERRRWKAGEAAGALDAACSSPTVRG